MSDEQSRPAAVTALADALDFNTGNDMVGVPWSARLSAVESR